MSDEEVLELAAKAAGIRHTGFTGGRGLCLSWNEGKDEYESGWWNPLENDGDALRLAVKLRMEVFVHQNLCRAASVEGAWADCSVKYAECGDDTYAATRRAIVRAAAEIGKDKQ